MAFLLHACICTKTGGEFEGGELVSQHHYGFVHMFTIKCIGNHYHHTLA